MNYRPGGERSRRCHNPIGPGSRVGIFDGQVGLMLGLAAASVVQAAPVTWAGNGHSYEVVVRPYDGEPIFTWQDARAEATTRIFNGASGYLGTITSLEEQAFLSSTVLPPITQHWATWLGGYQPDGENDGDAPWVWVTGEPWAYTNWGGAEPNGWTNENYLHIYNGSGEWNDAADNNGVFIVAYLVEYSPVPIPPAIYLLGASVLGLLRLPRTTRRVGHA